MKRTDTEMRVRTAIMDAIKRGIKEGMTAGETTVLAMSLALNCAESCIVAAKDGQEATVRDKLADAFTNMAKAMHVFEVPSDREMEHYMRKGQDLLSKMPSAWDERR